MQDAGDNDDAVKAAIASGEWREKKDPKSGRTYYVNVRTKASVWSLSKELRTSGSGSASVCASAGPDTAQSQAQRWQAEEAQLSARVTALESERVRLESELRVLCAPAASSLSALRAERARLQDAAHSLEAAVAADLSARDAKAAELSRLRQEVEALRRARQAEREAASQLRLRLAALRLERDEAAADLKREEAAGAALEAKGREAEAELRAAEAEEARVAALLQRQAEDIARAREELRSVCAQRAEAERRRERLEGEAAAIDRGRATGQQKQKEEDEEDEEGSPVLARLERDVRRIRRAAEADAMDAETAQLQCAAEKAAADARRAAQWAKEMRAQLRAVRPLIDEALRGMVQMRQEMRGA